jgi:hypothetical protein
MQSGTFQVEMDDHVIHERVANVAMVKSSAFHLVAL